MPRSAEFQAPEHRQDLLKPEGTLSRHIRPYMQIATGPKDGGAFVLTTEHEVQEVFGHNMTAKRRVKTHPIGVRCTDLPSHEMKAIFFDTKAEKTRVINILERKLHLHAETPSAKIKKAIEKMF